MKVKEEKIIFTDLDGTLIDENYSFKKALSALQIIKKEKTPLIFCTSKTRAEIEIYRKKIKNNHPFISENGGAIFIPKNYFKKKFNYDKEIKNYYVIELGTPYKKLKETLDKIEEKVKAKIISFGNMSIEDLIKDSELTKQQAALAKKREYDEAFKLIGTKKQKQEVFSKIKKAGLNYTEGGRYLHIMGKNNKGKAVKMLANIYKEDFEEDFETIGLGDSKNDEPMLRVVDKAFLIKKPDNKYSKLKIKNLHHSNKIGPEGWNESIKEIFWKLDIKKAEAIYDSSINILKRLQLPNGAILASSPKGRYPYIYPRDHAICILALIDAGLRREAKNALEFVMNAQDKNGSFPQRINRQGNDASYKPIQLDNTGLILYAFAKYVKQFKDKRFLKKHKERLIKSEKYLTSQLHNKYLFFTPNSIHEFPPYEEGLEIWANAICYSAIKELKDLEIKTRINLRRLKKSFVNHFWNGEYFIKNIRINESSSVAKEIDPSGYAMAYFDVFADSTQYIKKHVKKTEKELWNKNLGGLCRYPKHIGRNNGGWGPWPHITLMVCHHYIKTRQKKKAEKYLDWILNISLKNMLPEHIATKSEFEEWVSAYKKAGIIRKDREIMIENIRKSPAYKKGLAYSVLPLAWPHAEFIRTWILYKKEFLK